MTVPALELLFLDKSTNCQTQASYMLGHFNILMSDGSPIPSSDDLYTQLDIVGRTDPYSALQVDFAEVTSPLPTGISVTLDFAV